MKTSLFTDVISLFRIPFAPVGRRRGISGRQQKADHGRRLTPQLEVLEDRCLLSTATATVPSLGEVPPVIAAADILSAAQAKGDPSVVFVGDSISWEYAYGTGSTVWNGIMAPLGMANYGVFGQTTQSLLFQLSLGQLSGINPAVVVLDIGANNLLQGNSPQDTAEGVLADVAMIHQYLPQSQVIVLAVFPGMESPTDPYRSEGAQTNQLVSQMLAGDPQATFVNLGSLFLQPDGTISTSMMFDYLHPTTAGYVDLTYALVPAIEQAVFPNLATASPPSSNPVVSLTPSDFGSLLPSPTPTPTQPSTPLPISP